MKILCCGFRRKDYFFLYVSKPYVLEEGENTEWAGMFGSITKVVKKESRKIEEKISDQRKEIDDQRKESKATEEKIMEQINELREKTEDKFE